VISSAHHNQHLERPESLITATTTIDSSTSTPFSETLEDLIRRLLALTGQLTGMESTYLTRIEYCTDRQHILYARNSGELELPEGLAVPWNDTLCRRALEDETFQTSDIIKTWPDATAASDLGLRSYASVPVKFADGTVYGTLCAASRRKVEVAPETMSVMDLLSRLISRQIEAEDRLQFAEERYTRMALVAEVGRLCLDARALRPALNQTAALLASMPPWQRVIPFECRDGHYQVIEAANAYDQTLVEAVTLAFGEAVSRLHDEHNQPLLGASQTTNKVRQLRVQQGLVPDGPTALLTAATLSGLEAGIVLLANSGEELERRDGQMLVNCSNFLSMLADRLFHQGVLEATNETLSIQASRDPLTGLANRRSLTDALERTMASASRNGEQLFLAFIDLDGFKRINDLHGHEAGDLFLISLARRLQNQLRSDDMIARVGGDEFVVFTTAGPGRIADDIGRNLTDRIDQAMIGRHDLGTVRIDYTGASIGVVGWQGESMADLLNRADQAMYAIKQKRRGL